jgi:hypothetical protein
MSDFVIFAQPTYMVFRIEILHVCRYQHCLYLDLISEFFEIFKK